MTGRGRQSGAAADTPMSNPMHSQSSQPHGFSRSTWAEINLAALRHNARAVRVCLRPQSALIAVVKANAYGHGAVQVARALTDGDAPLADMLAVASVDEGIELRDAGIKAPILLLSAILPEEARAVVRANLMATVFTTELAQAVSEAAAHAGVVADVHVKADTGMGRLGAWHESLPELYRQLRQLPAIHIAGIYTHFACADDLNDKLTGPQLEAFTATLAACSVNGSGPHGILIHAANSAALLRYPDTHFAAARPGLALFGVSPLPSGLNALHGTDVELQPVMTLRSRITHLKHVTDGATVSYGATWRATRQSLIATVPVGYADGYPRCLSNRAKVRIGDTMCPVVGRVTMDQILVDCTDIRPNPCLGANVTLFGPELLVSLVAEWADTIPYEILCGVAHRVPRVYVDNGESVAP